MEITNKPEFITGFSPATSNGKSPKTFVMVFIGLLVAGIVFYLYLLSNSSPGSLLNPLGKPFGSGSKTQNMVAAPLTGILVSKEIAQEWSNIRPLGVMINNHVDARPQSGLIDADLVYEIVAEGGITRYLAFFLSNTPEKIGPIRSTREYYLVLVKEMGDAMLMHIGWSPQALEAIESWPVRSLGRGGADFWRDQARLDAGIATEHTAYSNGKDLRALGDKLGWSGKKDIVPYKFKDDKPVKPEQLISDITVDFWYPGDYTAGWKFDSASNSYLRFIGYDEKDQRIPHIDQESKKQLSVKNLIVQFATEEDIADDEKGRLDYQLIGTGEGLVFIDGGVIPVTWTKPDRDSRTVFYTQDGAEVEFNRGKFWISIVPDRNVDQVVYK